MTTEPVSYVVECQINLDERWVPLTAVGTNVYDLEEMTIYMTAFQRAFPRRFYRLVRVTREVLNDSRKVRLD